MKYAIKAKDGTYYCEPYVGHCNSYPSEERVYTAYELEDAQLYGHAKDALDDIEWRGRSVPKFSAAGGAHLVGVYFIEETVAAFPCENCPEQVVEGCSARRCAKHCDDRCDTHCDRSMGEV